MKKSFFVMILVLFLVSCSSLLSSQPEFINHEKPEVTQDISIFDEVGCPANEYGTRRCQPSSPLLALGCSRIKEPKALLGFLEPQVPIMTCIVDPVQNATDPYQEIEKLREEGSYITARSGLAPEFYRYVVSLENRFAVVATREDFQKLFAPVGTSEEALSYALALTSFRAYYGLTYDPDLEYFVSTFSETAVPGLTYVILFRDDRCRTTLI